MFTPEATAREVAFIEEALALAPDAAVLDLGCGFGRHAVALAQRASRVVSRQVLLAPEGGVRSTKEYTLRVYTCAELTALLQRHGLRVREVWGGADRSVYSVESRRLVLLAESADDPHA